MAAQVVLLEDGRIKTSPNVLERLAVAEAKLEAIRSIACQPPPSGGFFQVFQRLNALEQKFEDICDALGGA